MSSPASTILRRALLYVPASSPRMLAKSLTLRSDNVTYDLEDSVTPSHKRDARKHLCSHLSSLERTSSIGDLAVRINGVSTPHALEDLRALAGVPNLETIVVPKVNSASDLSFVTDVLRHVAPERHSAVPGAPPIKLIALIESARAIMDLRSICAASPYLDGLIFGAEDFAADLCITRTPSLKEFMYARSAMVTAARAFHLSSCIDLVCTAYKGPEAKAVLEKECLNGKEMGFNGKQCIHPDQVAIVQNMFAPSEAEVEWAVRLLIADRKASEAGRGAWTLQGKMIDAPVAARARVLVTKAKQCGFDVDSMNEKWQHQEPE
ncbi:Pyruvate/Phosphoenolpyruvate kinase-like domain-containing protein [Cercophora scortea]|uniref:Pyruvate/Phosphoenolpyruvate kinase-like domain-containing protein n=1 Tax=Cercophora scortea TaxID=314031 RepID=A0AAE0J4R9_9PEZI|nr:Pyruvate/Phosphoenolpyruvate kinase-like domain-containing protein [Cercophora scortea]